MSLNFLKEGKKKKLVKKSNVPIQAEIVEENMSMIQKIPMIDLFTGTGAFSYAFEQTGLVDCIFANDMVVSSEQIYKLNFPISNYVLNDLNEINVESIPQHRILTGGFPCQGFSIAGKQLGFDDPRSNVFWKILEILRHHNTEIVLLENVKNLKSHDDGNTYRIIEEELTNLGYYIKSEVLDTSLISGVPQHRERIYIVCFKDRTKYERFEFNFEEIQPRPISDFLERNVNPKYYYTDKLKVYDEINKSVTKSIDENIVYQYRRYYVRENKSGCCPTLTANMGEGGHNVPIIKDSIGIRKLTPRECFNLQGFPSDYKLPEISDSKLYKLAGNAVSVPVIQLISRRILDII